MEKKLLDKLNKLLALSKSPNVNEGNLALEMAEKLMNENGISYSDLDKGNIENTLGSIDKETMKFGVKNLLAWEKLLGKTIAEHFDCIFYTKVTYREELYHGRLCKIYAGAFIGHEANRRTSIIMYEWLHKLILKEGKKKYSRYSDINSYCLGAVTELGEKYKKESSKENKSEKGLMVVNEVEQWTKENMTMKTKSLTLRSNSESFDSGKSLGSSLSLNKQFNLKAISA